MRSLTELYDLNKLAADALDMIADIGHETGTLMVDDISEGWVGWQQIYEVVEFFGLDVDPESEFAWDEVERTADKLANELNERLPLPCDWVWEFKHNDVWGDYGLFVVK